jgi:hypothetical protein
MLEAVQRRAFSQIDDGLSRLEFVVPLLSSRSFGNASQKDSFKQDKRRQGVTQGGVHLG